METPICLRKSGASKPGSNKPHGRERFIRRCHWKDLGIPAVVFPLQEMAAIGIPTVNSGIGDFVSHWDRISHPCRSNFPPVWRREVFVDFECQLLVWVSVSRLLSGMCPTVWWIFSPNYSRGNINSPAISRDETRFSRHNLRNDGLFFDVACC